MAKCTECKRVTSEDMTFVIEKGICPYCGGRFIDSDVLNAINDVVIEAVSASFPDDFSDDKAVEISSNISSSIVDGLFDKFEIYPKSKLVGNSSDDISTDNLKPGSRKSKPIIRSGQREGGGIPDKELYLDAFNEDAELYDDAVNQTISSQGEQFVVQEESEESEIERLKALAAKGEEFVAAKLSKKDLETL